MNLFEASEALAAPVSYFDLCYYLFISSFFLSFSFTLSLLLFCSLFSSFAKLIFFFLPFIFSFILIQCGQFKS